MSSKCRILFIVPLKCRQNAGYQERKRLLKLKDTNEKKYITVSGNVYSNMISKLPCALDGLSNGCVFRRMRKIFSYVFVDEIQDFAGYDLEVIKNCTRSVVT